MDSSNFSSSDLASTCDVSANYSLSRSSSLSNNNQQQASMTSSEVEHWERNMRRQTRRADRCEAELVELRELLRQQELKKATPGVVRICRWFFGLHPDVL